jgi:hypothetical protein
MDQYTVEAVLEMYGSILFVQTSIGYPFDASWVLALAS